MSTKTMQMESKRNRLTWCYTGSGHFPYIIYKCNEMCTIENDDGKLVQTIVLDQKVEQTVCVCALSVDEKI